MFRIVGQPGKDLCDRQLKVSRRDVLRVGGSGMLGLSLGGLLKLRAASTPSCPSRRRLEQSQEHHSRLPSGWSQPSGFVGS